MGLLSLKLDDFWLFFKEDLVFLIVLRRHPNVSHFLLLFKDDLVFLIGLWQKHLKECRTIYNYSCIPIANGVPRVRKLVKFNQALLVK